MPTYFFNIRNTDGLIVDDEGITLPNIEAARREAIFGLREIAANLIKTGEPTGRRKMQVTNEAGEVLFTVSCKYVISA
jgi:Domain of unknown function (DUF6894)